LVPRQRSLVIRARVKLQLQPFVSLTGNQNLPDIIFELNEGVVIGGAVIGELKTVTAAQDAAPSEVTPNEMIVDKVAIWNESTHFYSELILPI
jgi:hypothetical protein